MANISQYHGEVSECTCDLYRHPEKQGPTACKLCYGRGFVAACKGCRGKGKNEVPVNGNDPSLGVMSSTCSLCGGIGMFGVNKPADWDATHPVAAELPQESVAATA